LRGYESEYERRCMIEYEVAMYVNWLLVTRPPFSPPRAAILPEIREPPIVVGLGHSVCTMSSDCVPPTHPGQYDLALPWSCFCSGGLP